MPTPSPSEKRNRPFFIRWGRIIACVSLFGVAVTRSSFAENVTIEWFGQSCVLVTTPDNVKILMDPIPSGLGFEPPHVKADVVTISHEHNDHSSVASAQGKYSLLRGLYPDANEWNKVDFSIGDAHLFNVASYHDNQQGIQRGLNSIFVIELPNFKLAHLGDLGHVLEEAQIQALRGCDVLLIPAGGAYTLSPADADKVVTQLQPRSIVIPMHYKTGQAAMKELGTVDAFLRNKNVVRVPGRTYKFDLSSPPLLRTYVVLTP
ncbi:MAG TPA: MBL fold metallo-hydrolase [Elusimicrobiota bacterium]|nr:MBL fold metallo-hydrolase [Elusimicrobiota bacterium]